MKRSFDFTIAFLLLILLSPALLLLATLIKVNLGRPVIFSQNRPGLNGKIFKMYKFRSMTDEKDRNGVLLANELRHTKFGKKLRSTSLDELPELWNVLKGDMSLVGPRPLLVEYLKLYSPEQFKRHLVKPGITGWAQVNGRNSISWEDKFALDIWYVNNSNFWLDIKILALTIIKVFSREGINSSQKVTMQKFEGSSSKKEKNE